LIFVTGTDTGCGKTTVGRALAAALRATGRAVAAFKPFESGCEERDGRLVAADAEALAHAAGCRLPGDVVCPFRLRLPASPERAAEAEGVTLTLAPLLAAWAHVRAAADHAVVEGAGGLLVPVAPGLVMADLPRALGLPVLVVARDALGTVNHTLLTLEAIRARGLDLRGVVFSSTAAGAADLANAAAVERHGGVPVLGALPHLPGADDAALARAAAAHLDVDAVFGLD
jgi:dethiobiotin synthetase